MDQHMLITLSNPSEIHQERLFYTIRGYGVAYIFSDRSGLIVHMVLDPTIEKDMTGYLFRLR